MSSACGNCLARACYDTQFTYKSFNYSISRVSYVHSSRTTDESLHFTVLPCHLRKCRLPRLYCNTVSAYDQISLQRSTRNFEIRRQVLSQKNDEIKKKKTHTHTCISLSLYLPIRRCTPERMCMHQSLSLSLSLSLCLHLQKRFGWIQIRPEWNSGKNVSPIEKFVHAIESTQSRCAQ